MFNDYNSFLFLLFLLLNAINPSTSWDYRSEGTDWVNSCKGENQAPMDISGPFLYKGIIN